MKMPELAKQIVETLREDLGNRVKALVDPILERLGKIEDQVKALPAEAVKGEPGEPGKDGAPGKDAPAPTDEQLAPLVKAAVESHTPALVDQAVKPAVDAAVAAAVKELPAPENGRDALDIDILPGIDVDKSVSRGTYAAHAGGLWRSFQRTQGMKGWECLVDGIAGIEVSQDGERGFSLKITRSSGEVTESKFELPVMIYRGVYAEGNKYARGDTVTSGGSLWHCEKETTEAPGTGCKDWKLAAKRGRDGADGKPGKQGERGLPGKDAPLEPNKLRLS